MATLEFPPARTTGLLTVVLAGEGMHLFSDPADPRVRVTDAGETADLVLFPCGTDRKFERVTLEGLPGGLQERVRAGQTGLVFDASTEGVAHSAERTALLHGTIARLGATPGQCVYVTQDRGYRAAYDTHCETHGIGSRVRVMVHDTWIWHTLADLATTGEARFEQGLAAFQARASQRPRRFVSLNRTPRPGKILFLLRLLRDGLWDEGFISFGGWRKPGAVASKDRPTREQLLVKLPGCGDLLTELEPWLDELEARGPLLLRSDRTTTAGKLPTPEAVRPDALAEYDESWFTVVTETEMRTWPSRITEKVLKPLLNFHPFLVLGNPGSLAMVRELGFQTFPGLFDESYDAESEPRRRFDAMYEQFTRACRMPEADLRRHEGALREVLIGNARHGFTYLPSAGRARHLAALVDTLIEMIAQRRSAS